MPPGRILGVAPGLPTTDMARTVEQYRRLGFAIGAPGSDSEADADFAITERDGIELHLALKEDHDPARTATWIYLRVDDADRMAAEFAATGVRSASRPTTPTTRCASWPTSTRTATSCSSALIGRTPSRRRRAWRPGTGIWR